MPYIVYMASLYLYVDYIYTVSCNVHTVFLSLAPGQARGCRPPAETALLILDLVSLTGDKAASILNVASDCASLDAPRGSLPLPPT